MNIFDFEHIFLVSDELYQTPADFSKLTQNDFNRLLSYSASSPDEEALVKGASHFGYTFFAKSQTTYFVRVRDGPDSTKDLRFEFKDMIEFDRYINLFCMQ